MVYNEHAEHTAILINLIVLISVLVFFFLFFLFSGFPVFPKNRPRLLTARVTRLGDVSGQRGSAESKVNPWICRDKRSK